MMELFAGKFNKLGYGLKIITALSYFSFVVVNAYQPGDRVSALSQTAHNKLQTPYLDFPLPQMPRFAMADNFIFHANLPQQNNSGLSGTRINPNSDLKISFTFDRSKLSVPSVTVFDSKNRISLKKIIITFTHDEFELVRVDFKPLYGKKISRLDPSHPALRGFEVEYKWDSVQEEDFELGVATLFLSAVLGFFLIFFLTVCREDHGVFAEVSSSTPKRRRSGTSSTGRFR